jgi:hypothetical protein
MKIIRYELVRRQVMALCPLIQQRSRTKRPLHTSARCESKISYSRHERDPTCWIADIRVSKRTSCGSDIVPDPASYNTGGKEYQGNCYGYGGYSWKRSNPNRESVPHQSSKGKFTFLLERDRFWLTQNCVNQKRELPSKQLIRD